MYPMVRMDWEITQDANLNKDDVINLMVKALDDDLAAGEIPGLDNPAPHRRVSKVGYWVTGVVGNNIQFVVFAAAAPLEE